MCHTVRQMTAIAAPLTVDVRDPTEIRISALEAEVKLLRSLVVDTTRDFIDGFVADCGVDLDEVRKCEPRDCPFRDECKYVVGVADRLLLVEKNS